MPDQDPVARLNAALTGRYRVERELGAGGMATVYLADDLKHDRKVALKVLRPELAAVMGAERFLAEIKTTANLQHPNILPLFDSGEAGGFLFYVMPYVEGESLREKLDRERQLPVAEAVGIGRDVAEALQAAHEQGVIHRDVKPANILLSRGRPLVADFGIALAVSAAGGGRLTETGLSVGTPFYMSPEQASADREPTRASDVYSLACVLYEMLVGEPPYTGGSAQAVLAKILTEDPAPSRSKRPSVPGHVDAAIRKALERLPADRFASAEDFAGALDDPGFRHGADVTGVARVGAWRRRTIGTSVAAVALGLTTALAVAWGVSRAPEAREPTRSYLLLPPDVRPVASDAPVFTPDGTLLVSGVVGGRPAIFRRGRGELDFTLVPGTEGGRPPAVSADGRTIVFRTPSGIARVSLTGGPVTQVVAAAQPLGIAWGTDGAIYYAPDYNQGIWRVRTDEPRPVQITGPDAAADELGHWWPQLLPDGEHLLFTAYRSPTDSSRIQVVSLRTGDVTTVLRDGFSAQYAPSGHLVFARGSALYAIAFELGALTTSGAPEVVVDGVAMEPQSGRASYGLSHSGTLVYAATEDLFVPSRIVQVERATGVETELPPPPDVYEAPALSPDGRTLVLAVRRPGTARDVITFDVSSAGRFQYLAQGATDEFGPLWTPDGERVVYVCEDPAFDLCWRAPNSSEPERKLWASGYDKLPSSFTPDGERLVFEERAEESRFLALSLANPELPPDTLLTFADIRPLTPRLSPDGRWMAYVVAEAGSEGIWIESLDSLRSRLRIAPAGASSPRWTKGGREIVYRAGSDDPGVFAVPIDPATGRPDVAERLFDDVYDASIDDNWHVTPDGERFVMVKPLENRGVGRLVMVQDFFTELERLLPN